MDDARTGWRQSLRRCLERDNGWTVAYLLFVCGFFFIPLSKLHNNFYYLCLLLPALLQRPRERVRRCWPSPLYRLALALILWLAISNFWLMGMGLGDLKQSLFHGLYVAVFLTLGVDLAHREASFRPRLVRWLTITVTLCAPLSMAWFYSGYLGGWIDSPDGRLQGLGRVDHSGLAATCYAMVGWLAYWDGIRQGRQDHRGLWFAGVAASLAFVVLAGSRGALLALLGSAALLICLNRRGSIWWLATSAALGYLLLVATGALEFGRLTVPHGGDSFRLAIWSQSLDHWLAAPWLGHGLGQDFSYRLTLPPAHPMVNHPHNAYLGTALYGGLGALLLLLALLGGALYRSWQALRERGDGAVLASLLLGSLFIFTDGARLIDNPQPFWLYLWLPLSLAIAGDLDRRRLNPVAGSRTDPVGPADYANCAEIAPDPGGAAADPGARGDTASSRPDR